MKNIWIDILKHILYNSEGRISFTKMGAMLISVCGIIIAVPPAAAEAGIQIDVPSWLTTISWLFLFIGGKLGIDGARDALDKTKKN